MSVQPASSLDGMAAQALEDQALHLLAVRNPQATCWRPSCPDLLAGQDLLVACSRNGWERLLVLTASQQQAVQRG